MIHLMITLILLFSVCFSINDYKNCSKFRMQEDNSDIIYHNGSCVTDYEDLKEIRMNMSHFYRLSNI